MTTTAPPNLVAALYQLRRDYPHVGILADVHAGRWIAVLDRHHVIRAGSPITLRDRIETALRHRPHHRPRH